MDVVFYNVKDCSVVFYNVKDCNRKAGLINSDEGNEANIYLADPGLCGSVKIW